MNPIADHIRDHLAQTGKSMRALSLELGQGEKFIADVLSGKSRRPTPAALAKLSSLIGGDLGALPVQRRVTAAEMERMLREHPPAGWSASKISGALSALAWYVRASGAGGPQETLLDRSQARGWLGATTPAAHGMAATTFATYASHLRNLIDMAAGAGRPRQMRDVTGPWRQLHDALRRSAAKEYEHFVAGP